jgi:hypothetical protein
MKKTLLIILIVLLGLPFISKAQNIPYEKLDSISQYISQRQFEANDKSYIENNQTIKVSFPKENFKIYYGNLLATNAVVKMTDNHEVTELTENIDLSEVQFITIISTGNYFFTYRLEFPSKSIETQIYEDGNFKETQIASEIYLYAENTKWGFYDEIVKLCHNLKNEKNKNGKGYNVAKMSTDWNTAKVINTVSSYQNFVNKYPLSLYSKETWVLLDAKKKEIQDEADRLEKIRIEKLRIQQEAERERIRKENERLAKIAEEARLKAERLIGFFGFRIGYVMPTNEDSQKVSGIPNSIISNPNYSPGPVYPLAEPYKKGQFGLKLGYNAGFTGIINLEFINKNLPSWIGIGLPVDFNATLMQYSWEELGTNDGVNSFVYQDAEYSSWGIGSVGAGLSLSFHPAKRLFIDILARADYYGTFGGDYKIDGTNGTNGPNSGVFKVKTERESESFGLAKTIGLNIRYKKIMLGFEMKKDIIDEAEFIEKIDTAPSSRGQKYPIKNPGLNLDNMQFTFGYIF